MEPVSIIIPSRNEKHLNRTILDIQTKATGSIEIIVVVEGQPVPLPIPDVIYIYNPEAIGMKYAINQAAAIAKGKYLMKIDAHCIVAPGFDRQLIADHQPDWIQVPRRYSLLEKEWRSDFNDPIDYEYYVFPLKYPFPSLHGLRWKERSIERKDILIDDILTFQGSFWFMTRDHWNKHDFMHDEGYNELHAQEAAYLGNATWLSGGRVVVNKKTWYSHLYKTKEIGRGYRMNTEAQRECYKYSYKHWVQDNKEGFIALIERFWPVPGWPVNWKERLWN